MQNKRILAKAGFFVVVLIILLSTSSGAIIKNLNQEVTSDYYNRDYMGYGLGNMKGDIVWDNGFFYDYLIRAEYDSNASVDAFPADDFSFENNTIIDEVGWIGGYWDTGYNMSHWTWKIEFYKDDGTGEKPGDLYVGNFTFEVCNYTEIFIEEITNWSIYYEINVTLPQDVMFEGGEKYWISIWAVGNEPPYPGWAYHYNSTILHEAVFKSVYFFGDLNWHDTGEVLKYPADLCFQLGGYERPEDRTPPTVEITSPRRGLYIFDRFIIPRFIRITQAIGKLTISVNATDNESGINRVEFYYGPLGRKLLANVTEEPYNVTWKIDRPRFIHVHILKVVAYDNCDNNATDWMLVRKII
jgi:hypothetical protein